MIICNFIKKNELNKNGDQSSSQFIKEDGMSKALQFPTQKEYYNDLNDIQKSIESLKTQIQETSKSDVKWFVGVVGVVSAVGLSIMGGMFLFLWNNFDEDLTRIEFKLDNKSGITEAQMVDTVKEHSDQTLVQIKELKKLLISNSTDK